MTDESKDGANSDQYFATRNEAIKAGIGQVMAWAGPTGEVPDGFLLCDGRELKTKEYFKLFSVIGNTYGSGQDGTTFLVPNLMQRTVLGSAPKDEKYKVGNRVGSPTSQTQIQLTLPGQGHFTTFTANLENPWPVNHAPGGSVVTANADIETVPPAIVMNYIVKFK